MKAWRAQRQQRNKSVTAWQNRLARKAKSSSIEIAYGVAASATLKWRNGNGASKKKKTATQYQATA